MPQVSTKCCLRAAVPFTRFCCSDFAVKFGLNSLPTVVVISQSKKKFVNLVGIFDEKTISSFLDGVLSGKHGTSSFQDLPQVRAAGTFASLGHSFSRAAQQARMRRSNC
jgi:thioredoxin-like negative regulator of GroEL